MPEIVTITRTPVSVEKSIAQLEQELSVDGNVDWDVVAKAYKAQFPKDATMTDEESKSIHCSWFNRIMVRLFVPYMKQMFNFKVTGMRTTCDAEITRDCDNYVELACYDANPSQNHWVTMNIDGDVWDMHFVEYSYETDDNTQLSLISIRKNGAVLAAVDEKLVNECDWDALISACRKTFPDSERLLDQKFPPTAYVPGTEVNDPCHFHIRYENQVATTILLLVYYYASK